MTHNEDDRHNTGQATRITLVRHGEVHNPNGIIYGRLPGFGLSERGRQQAQAAAEALRDQRIDALYVSPQPRALQTAQFLREAHPHLDIVVSPLLDEVLSAFEGRPFREAAACDWNIYAETDGEAESPQQISDRAARFIRAVRASHPGQHVVAVTHGDIITFALLWAMGEPPDPALKRTLTRFGITDGYPAPASLTTFVYHSDDPDERPQIFYLRPYDLRS